MLNESNIPLEEDGIEEEILVDEEVAITKAMWGDVGGNIENQTDLQNALDAKQDSLTEAQLNAVNSGITSEKVTTYDGYADQIASKADQSALNAESIARGEADTALGTRIDNEALARQSADNGLQSQIDAITSKSDVVDVVANYAALQAYDTSTLGNNDVVKVLDDETHEDALTYYRWSTTTQTWSYIGQEAPYYSKGQMDTKLAEKQDKLTAGANIQIQNGTISATDTKYTNGNGLNLNGTEFSANTDVLATKEDLEGYYTKPETDNLLAPKLEAEVVAELPTTGAEGKLYLTPKAHTTSTATGNPITATVAEEAGAIESFQLDGDTFQQTYTGKNLCGGTLAQIKNRNKTGTWNGNQYFQSGITWTVYENADGTIDRIEASGQATENGKTFYIRSFDRQQFEEQLGSEKTYTLSGCPQGGDSGYYVRVASLPWKVMLTDRGSAATGTLVPADNYTMVFVVLCVDIPAGQVKNLVFRPQLELGSTATAYEPFVGGQPSPSPGYPQPIQTVTGLRTISINGTNYPLDLGSIELCKLGTYQDYIWKDGDDWKVHKATNSITYDGTNYGFSSRQGTGASGKYRFLLEGSAAEKSIWEPSSAAYFKGVCDILISGTRNSTYSYAASGNVVAPRTENGYGNVGIVYADAIAGMTYEQANTWLTTHNMTIKYALETPTDTTITDTTLIAQLEAIRTASLQNGANTITNTATGANLAGDMEVDYYGYNPTNRYDKWLWLDINNAYEQLNNPDTSSTLSTLSTRSLGTTAEQPTVTRSLETETITLKKGETEPIEDKTELPTILDEEAEETETTEPEESDGTDER